jgi:hypothetical protein
MNPLATERKMAVMNSILFVWVSISKAKKLIFFQFFQQNKKIEKITKQPFHNTNVSSL